MAALDVTSILPHLGLLSVLVALLFALSKRVRQQDTELPQRSKDHFYQSLEKPRLGAELVQPLKGFDWSVQQPHKFRPFKSIYHITMAIKSDTASELITIDRDYLDRIQLRKTLIQSQGQMVHGCVPAGVDAVNELYTYLLAQYLPKRYPTMFKLSVDSSKLENLVTSDIHSTTPPVDHSRALQVMGTTVEEDLFILKPTPEGHQCVAFMCCFPSGWSPSSKLGKHMNQIHSNVPSYDKIGPSMERFFTKLEVGKNVKRTNWTIQTHGELFNAKGNHVTGEEEVESEQIDPEKTYLRIELQTLSRLPKTHSILFSFKTYLYPLREIKEEGLGAEFATAIEGLEKGNAPGMWKYKGAVRWGASVCEYLRS
ncbi:hypothetical protein N0V84_006265 [Fusarium piperis]|uniref:Uncharacterized protein n=1 Tax=Fusarium piperis TaxID=1435070 RepID=A0A9W8WCH0_9HYPO|nr:hypothetical protein N0V84_006265 [Fusarium piperis]